MDLKAATESRGGSFGIFWIGVLRETSTGRRRASLSDLGSFWMCPLGFVWQTLSMVDARIDAGCTTLSSIQ